MRLSVAIIAKNAEKQIHHAIKSVHFADEVIVIDNDSSDRTEEVAKKNGAEVYKSTSKNFSELRNFALSKAKGKWILYIDSDEIVTDILRDNIKINTSDDSDIGAFKIRRKNFYLGNFLWPQIEKLERLFKKEKLVKWYGTLHESPQFEGRTGELSGYLLHFTHQDLRSMVEKTIVWSEIEAKLRLKAHHPKVTWWRFFRVFITGFLDSYVRQKGFLAGTMGIIESLYQGFSIFITYARLWEMQKNEK